MGGLPIQQVNGDGTLELKPVSFGSLVKITFANLGIGSFLFIVGIIYEILGIWRLQKSIPYL